MSGDSDAFGAVVPGWAQPDQPAEEMPRRTMTPLGKLAQEYVRGRLQRKEICTATAPRVRSVLFYFCEMYGNRPVKRMSTRDIDRWLASRTHLAVTTLRAEVSQIRSFVRWLQRERHLRNDPLVHLRAPRVPRTVPRALQRDDVVKLWDVLPDDRARTIMALMVGLGLRRVEVARLQVGDYDHRQRTVRVVGKGGHERILPVPDWVATIVYACADGRSWGPMIQSTAKPSQGVSAAWIGQLMAGWMHEAGIKQRAYDGRGCHSLRHTLASEVADVEPDLRVVSQILGHQNLKSTQVYLRGVNLAKMRDAMDLVGDNRTA